MTESAKATPQYDLEKIRALVAERVMGWQRGRTGYGEMPWYPPGSTSHRHGGELSIPDYPRDPTATHELIDHMEADGWMWYAGKDVQGTFFQFVKRGAGEDGADLMASCQGHTFELNANLAALVAVGASPEEALIHG